MTTQELAQKILARLKEADDEAEGKEVTFRHMYYAQALDDIEKLCKEQNKPPQEVKL